MTDEQLQWFIIGLVVGVYAACMVYVNTHILLQTRPAAMIWKLRYRENTVPDTGPVDVPIEKPAPEVTDNG